MRRMCFLRLPVASGSQSVLRTLQRLRQQYQRPLQRSDGPLVSCEILQNKHNVADEALKLLRREVRGSEALSEVDATSSSFCVEVGKLLSVAAAFGASTGTQRVAEALQWVRVNKSSLITIRQVMSVAKPILHLKDGKPLGQRFVLEELTAPLLASLKAPVPVAAMSGVELKQHRGAIVSVFSLIARLLEGDGPSDTDTDGHTVAPVAATFAPMKATAALRKDVSQLMKEATDALMSEELAVSPLDVQECTHIFLAFQRFESLCSDEDAESFNDLKEMQVFFCRLQPLLAAALEPSSSFATRRPGDLLQLLSTVVKFRQREMVALFCRGAVSCLPFALASATVKEMCMTSSLLVRLRSSIPEVVDEPLARQVVDAMRPKLFLLADTHRESLRHVESSLLLGNLTRLDTAVSEDLVNLLSSSFASHAESVEAPHLIPFLQGLCRFNDYRERFHKGSPTTPIWDSPMLPAVLSCLRLSADRVVTLVSVGALKALEAAQLLLLFSRLHGGISVAVYAAVEPLVVAAANRFVSSPDAECSGDGGSLDTDPLGDEYTGSSGLFTLMNALDTFRSAGVAVREEEGELLVRAAELYQAVRQSVIGSIKDVQDPKSLVKLLNVLTPSLEAVCSVDGEDDAVRQRGSALMGPVVGGKLTVVEQSLCSSNACFDIVAHKVTHVAVMANAYEVGALSRHMKELMSKGLIDESVAKSSVGSLVERALCVELTLYDFQLLLDGMQQARCVPVPPALISRAAMLLREAPKKTVHVLRRILPLLKDLTARSPEKEAVSLLKHVAMQNARTLLVENGSAMTLRDIVMLAYTLAQIHLASLTIVAEGMEEASGVDTEHDERETLCDTPAPEDGESTVIHDAFTAIGDAASLRIQQLPRANGKEGGGGWQMTPQEVVMLVQSFERVGVSHLSLLYEVLPFVRDMSASMEPLELSLLLSAFARLGVWNGHILNSMAGNVADRMQTCRLKHCQVMLQALQSSRFLRSTAFLPSPGHEESLLSDWKSPCVGDGFANNDPLITLAASIVKRMDVLAGSADLVSVMLESHTLRDIVAAVRVLGFFDHPPQPSFDMYVAICVKKLVQSFKDLGGDVVTCECRHHLTVCAFLAGCASKLRKYRHQCILARTIAGMLSPRSTDLATLRARFSLLPEEKLSELYYYRCVFAMIYDTAFCAEDTAVFVEPLFDRLKTAGVSLNPQVICKALRFTTKLCSRNVGDSSLVGEIVLHCARDIYERVVSNAVENTGTIDRVEEAFSFPRRETITMIESLCAACLCNSPTDERWAQFQEILTIFTDHMFRIIDTVGYDHSLPVHSRDSRAPFSVRECSVVLLGMAIAGTANCQGGADVNQRFADLQRVVLMKEHDLSVSDSVSILIATSLCGESGTVCEDVVRCASRALQGQMGKTDRTGLWLLPELYRLVTAGGACFVTYCASLPATEGCIAFDTCLRVAPAFLRAVRSAKQDISPSLTPQCRVHVVECLQQLVKLSPNHEATVSLSAVLEELTEDVGAS